MVAKYINGMIAVAVCVAALNAAAIIILVLASTDSAGEARHLRERVALLEETLRVTKELRAKDTQIHTYRDAMGRVCQAAFGGLVRRLGLDRPSNNTAGVVLEAFDGLGGPK